MKEPTVEQLATIARAIGYTVTLDNSGGYGVVRLIATSPRGGQMVFRPHESAAQAWEVIAWLMAEDPCSRLESDCIFFDDGSRDYERLLLREDHDGTAAGIRRAVVDAAIRVAESMQATEDDGA